ncbi:uncharacterized protein LOC135832032 [Planococcus citri]|uniref:uncharacterized protein LOC135832032 n=1 Tax=Planococcus citri TaxID=170843 RepID=UPI0031F8A944
MLGPVKSSLVRHRSRRRSSNKTKKYWTFDTNTYMEYVAQEFTKDVLWTFPLDELIKSLSACASKLNVALRKQHLIEEQLQQWGISDPTESNGNSGNTSASSAKRARRSSSQDESESSREQNFNLKDSEEMCAKLEELKKAEVKSGEKISDNQRSVILGVLRTIFIHETRFSTEELRNILTTLSSILPSLNKHFTKCIRI